LPQLPCASSACLSTSGSLQSNELQAANSGGVTLFERNDDAQAFLFDPSCCPALVVFLLPFILGHQYRSRL
jgi:hypothetical protein